MKNKLKIGDEILVIGDVITNSVWIGRTGMIVEWYECGLKGDDKYYKNIKSKYPYLVKFNFQPSEGYVSMFTSRYVRPFNDKEIILSSSKEAERIYLQKYKD